MGIGGNSIQPAKIATASHLVAHTEQQIASGKMKPGDRLTPVRAAATNLGIAPNTVAAAYRRLQERGLIFSRGRQGSFVADRVPTLPRGEQPLPPDLTDLASGGPDPGLLPDLSSALGAVAQRSGDEPGRDHITYGQAAIDEWLAAILVADLEPDVAPAAQGPLVPGETLAVVGGALDGIERALAAKLRPGDLVAIEDPGYTSVLHLLGAMSLRTTSVAIDQNGPIPAALSLALAEGASAVIITPRAQNPTGAAMDQTRACDIANVLSRYPELLIIEDDYAGPVAGADYHSCITATARHWVVIRSVAKSLGPDLRLAAVVGDATTVRRIAARQMLGTGWVSHILQRTAATLLADPVVASQLQRAAETYGRRREHLIEELARGGIASVGRSGLNVWISVPDEAEVVAAMQTRGFAVRAGSRFRDQTPPAIRVTTAGASLSTLSAAAVALIEILRTGPAVRSV